MILKNKKPDETNINFSSTSILIEDDLNNKGVKKNNN